MSKKYTFIDNEPLGEDLFEGKGQDRISDVIVEIITNDKFKVIGIDGGWGTGKSNLVGIIDKKLPNHHFFIYDVWGHQEDEQRKAILVELTEYINNEKNRLVSNKKEWDKNLITLLANTKETTTINQPYLSIGFIFSLLSIVYIPTVNVFKDSMADFFDIKALFWKLVLVTFPIFIVLGIYIFNVIKEWFKKSGFWKGFKLAAQETFQVYTNKQKEETKVETISDNQPSVRDFQLWMKKIDNDLGKKKLVLVFDNFDRLPKKHILSIWSVIHIFFSETKYENIKIIIPFDRLHIKNAFKDLNGTAQDYANDYINKTFDIVYRVAPPILSSWKGFFKDNWKKAFPEYNELEYIKTEQAYEVLRPNITPREIIAFINEVVSLKLLDDTIPDRYISIFVLNKETIIENPLKAVTELQYLKGLEYSYEIDDDFQKYITALAYQIKPENALEVVYKKELKDCLINGNEDKLDEISKTKVFSRILNSTVHELENYVKAIETLNKLNEDAEISDLELHNIWDDIYLKQKEISVEKGKLAEFQLILLDKINTNFKSDWLSKITSNLYLYDKVFSSQAFAKNIDRLVVFCSEKKIVLDVFSYLKNQDVDVDQLKILIDTKNDEFKKYKLNCTKEVIETYLKERTAENFKDAEFIFHLEYKYELTAFQNQLITFIAGRENDAVFLSQIYKFLKNISKQPITNPLNDAQVYTLMRQVKLEDPFYIDLACMRIKLGSTTNNPSYEPVFSKALNSNDSAFYQKVAKEIEHYINLEELLISSIQFNNPLMKGIVPLLFELENDNRELDVKNIIENLIVICNANNLDSEKVFFELDQYEKEKFDYSFVFALSEEFFQKAKESDSEIAKEIIDIITDHFKNADNTIWKSVFDDLNSKELNILLIIGFLDWNSFALQNFKNKIIEIANNASIDNQERIQLLISSFENSEISLVNTFKDLRGEFIKNNNISKEHFVAFIEPLFKHGALIEHAGDVIRTIFKPEFLDDNDCVQLMISQNNHILKLIEKSDKTESSDFINGIIDRRTVNGIEELANNLNIKIPKLQKEDGEIKDVE
ncbi:MAG: hypothetical protein H3C31_10420 [Brumimicrobium sp.]|nr:hypothetical protein [Brumimicrobium sp.]